jgi:hypothetical protein
MRTTCRTALAVLVFCLPLAACSSGSDSKPAGKTSGPASAASTPAPPSVLALGTAAQTEGAEHPVDGPGGGVLEITPTTVVYTKTGSGQTPANGLFVTVAYKARSTTAVAAAQAAPIDGGGWQWVAPNGQAVDTLRGNASSVTPDGFTGAGPVQPGSFQWRSVTVDITEAQRGGTVLYIDGAHHSFQWKLPAQDTGPEAGALKKALGA